MNLTHSLEPLIETYVKEGAGTDIQHIRIHIPGYEGLFIIKDSFFISHFQANDSFRLLVALSFDFTTDHGKQLLEKIEQSGCLNDFIRKEIQKKKAMFLKETNNDQKAICSQVEHIVATLFPEVRINDITVALERWKTVDNA